MAVPEVSGRRRSGFDVAGSALNWTLWSLWVVRSVGVGSRIIVVRANAYFFDPESLRSIERVLECRSHVVPTPGPWTSTREGGKGKTREEKLLEGGRGPSKRNTW